MNTGQRSYGSSSTQPQPQPDRHPMSLDLSNCRPARQVAQPHITLFCYQLDAALDFEWETLFTRDELVSVAI